MKGMITGGRMDTRMQGLMEGWKNRRKSGRNERKKGWKE